MKRSLVVVLTAVVLLTAYYIIGGEVRPEGSLGDTYLVVKPEPSLNRYFGGGEEGAWVRAHPGQPSPWWQDLDERPSIYLGDWENGSTPMGIWNLAATLALIIAWLGLFGLILVYFTRRLVERIQKVTQVERR